MANEFELSPKELKRQADALPVSYTHLLSRFTKELVLCYDNDNAGKIATERALKDLDRKLRVVQDLQRPLRGDLAGVVIVVAQHQLLREPASVVDKANKKILDLL